MRLAKFQGRVSGESRDERNRDDEVEWLVDVCQINEDKVSQ